MASAVAIIIIIMATILSLFILRVTDEDRAKKGR